MIKMSRVKSNKTREISWGEGIIAYQGPVPKVFIGGAAGGGIGAVVGYLLGGNFGAILGAAIGGTIGAWLGSLSEEDKVINGIDTLEHT